MKKKHKLQQPLVLLGAIEPPTSPQNGQPKTTTSQINKQHCTSRIDSKTAANHNKQQSSCSTQSLPSNATTSDTTKKGNYCVQMKDFDLLKVLGTGAYGKVFLVRKLNGHDKGKLYAMKVLRKEVVAQKTKTLDHTRTERKVLESIRNEPFLVTMHYAFQTKTKLHLILDYVNGGELFTHLYQRDHFRENDVKIYISELILALEKLHKVSSCSHARRALWLSSTGDR